MDQACGQFQSLCRSRRLLDLRCGGNCRASLVFSTLQPWKWEEEHTVLQAGDAKKLMRMEKDVPEAPAFRC